MAEAGLRSRVKRVVVWGAACMVLGGSCGI